MKNIFNFFLLGLIGILFLGSFSGVYADGKVNIGLIPASQNELKGETCKGLFEVFGSSNATAGEFSFDMIGCYIVYLIDVFSKIAVMIAFVFVLIGAFKYTITYLTGDDDGKKAKDTIKNALVGLAVSTLAYVIVDVFIRFLL